MLERDTSQPHEVDAEMVASLEVLYRIHDDAKRTGNSERYYAQFRVAENLLEFDEKFAIWRFHHVKMVERMIGGMGGTGGSSGAKYLASTLARPFWPDLWTVRNRLGGGYGGAPAASPDAAATPDKPAGGGGCPYAG